MGMSSIAELHIVSRTLSGFACFRSLLFAVVEQVVISSYSFPSHPQYYKLLP